MKDLIFMLIAEFSVYIYMFVISYELWSDKLFMVFGGNLYGATVLKEKIPMIGIDDFYIIGDSAQVGDSVQQAEINRDILIDSPIRLKYYQNQFGTRFYQIPSAHNLFKLMYRLKGYDENYNVTYIFAFIRPIPPSNALVRVPRTIKDIEFHIKIKLILYFGCGSPFVFEPVLLCI